MKYMGGKAQLLKNGLGATIREELGGARRFVDLFAGSGAVSLFVATEFRVPVFACDLQAYCVPLVNSVVARRKAIDGDGLADSWFRRAQDMQSTVGVPTIRRLSSRSVKRARQWCQKFHNWPITRAYGGHYYSPAQAITIDALRKTMPFDRIDAEVALAALIRACSRCAAAPGHTAQPFQPTPTATQFLESCWRKSIHATVRQEIIKLSSLYALRIGKCIVADALAAAERTKEGDLIFIDPPYSGMHYSRFYHVLETVAHGKAVEVSGVGRYPPKDKRPQSAYSRVSSARGALEELLERLAKKPVRVIITFPQRECSNGLSGRIVEEVAASYFEVERKRSTTRFSTLGGSLTGSRSARQNRRELILTLRSKAK